MDTTPLDVIEGRERYCVLCADCRDVAKMIPDKSIDHVVADFPYSNLVHSNMKSNHGKDGIVDVDCGFKRLSPSLRRAMSRESTRVSRGWVAVFTDRESSWLWRISLTAAGGHYKRTIPWIRWSSPNFTRRAPPAACEDVVWCAAEKGLYFEDTDLMSYDARCLRASNKKGDHETEKPELLMLQVLSGCAKPGDIIVDWTCGSGSTLTAALRMGCRVIGCDIREVCASTARERCAAELSMCDAKGLRAGQIPLFGAQQ